MKILSLIAYAIYIFSNPNLSLFAQAVLFAIGIVVAMRWPKHPAEYHRRHLRHAWSKVGGRAQPFQLSTLRDDDASASERARRQTDNYMTHGHPYED